MGATKIAIGWIHPGDVTGCFAESLANTLLHDRRLARIRSTISIQSSPRIVEARSQMVDGFLRETRDDWLLMIDADMGWDFNAFEMLVKHADEDTVPIIGGLCFAGGRSWIGGKPKVWPTIYRTYEEDGALASEAVHDYERDSLVQVGGTGAAFLMVHRKVFMQMAKMTPPLPNGNRNPHPWFGETYTKEGRQIGEDITFCLRAQACGFPVHVHTGVKISHRKYLYLDEQYFDEVTSGSNAD